MSRMTFGDVLFSIHVSVEIYMLRMVRVHTSLGLLGLSLAVWASLSCNHVMTATGARASLDLV
jgi:hypothetical protein